MYFFGVLYLILFLVPSVFSVSLSEKVIYEEQLQKKAEQIITKIVGDSSRFVVIVDAEISSGKTVSPSITGSKSPVSKTAIFRTKEILPGIRADTIDWGEKESSAKEEPPKPVIISSEIKRVTMLIILDSQISDNVVKVIKKQIPELLGLNLDTGGDKLGISKLNFSRPDLRESLLDLVYKNLVWLLTVFLFMLFFFGPLRGFLRALAKSMEVGIQANARISGLDKMELTGSGGMGGGLPGGPLEINLERRRRKSEEEDGVVHKHFSFINADNLKNLLFLIKNESPANIAVVINYLPAEFASQVITSLAATVQTRVALELAAVKLKSAEEVTGVEKAIKEKIDYILGGEERFIDLLDQVDPRTQENILSTLARENPQLAEKLRKISFIFNDLVILDKIALQRVIRESQRNGVVMALALRNAIPEVKDKILACLSEGARAMLTEQIALIGDVSDKRVEDEQIRIVRIVRSLEKAGEIVIDRDKQQPMETEEKV